MFLHCVYYHNDYLIKLHGIFHLLTEELLCLELVGFLLGLALVVLEVTRSLLSL
jgi:hypothetical protein